MKLLTKPSMQMETITLGGCEVVEKRFNVLGLFGIGTLISERVRKTPKVNYAGRKTWLPVEIDFEDIAPAFEWNDNVGGLWPRKQDLELDGFVLHGVFPTKKLRDNVWHCYIDYSELSAA